MRYKWACSSVVERLVCNEEGGVRFSPGPHLETLSRLMAGLDFQVLVCYTIANRSNIHPTIYLWKKKTFLSGT